MKKSYIAIFISIVILLSSNISVLAGADNQGLDEDIYLLKEQMFVPDKLRNEYDNDVILDKDGLLPMYEEPERGTVKISDQLYNESGLIDGDLKTFTDFASFGYATITIVKRIPGIGRYVELGQEIYDALRGVYSDLNYINKSKQVTTQTWHTFRDFYHWLYVWDYGTWQDMGYSISRYYYKHLYMRYYNDRLGEYTSVDHHFNHSNRYDPVKIAEAPNYKDYEALTEIVYEHWVSNSGKYVESY